LKDTVRSLTRRQDSAVIEDSVEHVEHVVSVVFRLCRRVRRAGAAAAQPLSAACPRTDTSSVIATVVAEEDDVFWAYPNKRTIFIEQTTPVPAAVPITSDKAACVHVPTVVDPNLLKSALRQGSASTATAWLQ
jgi:hypothetical protein